MAKHKENEIKKNKTEVHPKYLRCKTRVRIVDFMRVEDTLGNCPLAPFDLEVKDKIACAASPSEELIQEEEAQARAQEVRNILANLIDKAQLTSNQKACYDMVYIEELTDPEIAGRLGIDKRNVRRLKQAIFKALKRVYEKQCLKDIAATYKLKDKQRLVISLYCDEQLCLREIANRLNMQVSSIESMLCRLRKKIF